MDPGAWSNVGLYRVKSPVDIPYNLSMMQHLFEEKIQGFTSTQGYNDFVLYGEEFHSTTLKIDTYGIYNFFTSMSWDNGAGDLIKEPGTGRGLFFRNDIDLSMEGWLCESRPLTLFGWECVSLYFPPEAFGDVKGGKYI